MQLYLEWSGPLALKLSAPKTGLIYDFVHSSAPTDPGIYIFGRLHSKKFEALYVGKAKNLQSRTKGQLKNLKLMLHLKGAKTGTRVVLMGRFRAATGQQSDRCLPILEKALIRHFLSEGHDLVNIQGTQVRRHEIATVGSKHIPKLIFVDRGKKE